MKLNINLMVKGEPGNFIDYSWRIFLHPNFISPNWRFGEQDEIKQHVRIILNIFLFSSVSGAEIAEVMEMDSPFSGAMIEGNNLNVLKKGSTITLTCKVMENEIEGNVENVKRIDWMKNGEPVNIEVRQIIAQRKHSALKASKSFSFLGSDD